MSVAEDLLNSSDFFECERTNCRMSKASCLRNQEMAAQPVNFDAYSGMDYPAISRKGTCLDCEQGQKIKEDHHMIGTCTNCKRPGILIVPGVDGICYSCHRFASRTRGDERLKKLAQAAEKYRDKPVQAGGRKAQEKKQDVSRSKYQAIEKIKKHLRARIAERETAPALPPAAQPESIAQPIIDKVRGHLTQMKEKTEQEQAKRGMPSVIIYFYGADADLYNHLADMAKRERRNPDQ